MIRSMLPVRALPRRPVLSGLRQSSFSSIGWQTTHHFRRYGECCLQSSPDQFVNVCTFSLSCYLYSSLVLYSCTDIYHHEVTVLLHLLAWFIQGEVSLKRNYPFSQRLAISIVPFSACTQNRLAILLCHMSVSETWSECLLVRRKILLPSFEGQTLLDAYHKTVLKRQQQMKYTY